MSPSQGMPPAAEIFGEEPGPISDNVPRAFTRVDDGNYRMALAPLGIEFEVSRLRRKWDELTGELAVRCSLAGARTFDGVLSVADFNLSSVRARQDRGRYLAARAKARDVDWEGLLEEFVQRVLAAERAGLPAVLLSELSRPAADAIITVDGLPLLTRHPQILFGDGGAAKSYLALYLAGRLEQEHGMRVGLFDWELSGEDHRDRLERIFGPKMPGIRYRRCDRPLSHDVDALRRSVRQDGLDFVILDSIAFACDGPPEAAEVAARYFQATRQLGIVGSLHIAHVSKVADADKKPFGSVYWHNGARATWYVKLAESTPEGDQINIGLYNRKSNLSKQRAPVGFEIAFTPERTTFRRIDIADVSDLAGHLSVRQRMAILLRRGAMSPEALAEELEVGQDTIKRYARDKRRSQFTLIPGGNIALVERRI